MIGIVDALPRDLRRFEALQIISTIAGFAHQIALHPESYLNGAVSSALVLMLTVTVTRGRMKWPLWILVGFYVLGILGLVYFYRIGAFFSLGSWLIVACLTVSQAVALALAFTRQSSEWLDRKPAHA